LLSCSTVNIVNASNDVEEDILCPGPDEAFVTTCSGGAPGGENDGSNKPAESVDEPSTSTHNNEKSQPSETIIEEDVLFNESDLVNEVLTDSFLKDEIDSQTTKQQQQPQPKFSSSKSNDSKSQQQKQYSFDDDGGQQQYDSDGDDVDPAAIQQLKQTTTKLLQKYYDPLPSNGKCAIGTICGFTASRLSLGVANRIFRIAGASYVLSEMAHTTGFCDEAQCVPEEARPWVGIIKRALIKQCIKVRLFVRKIWNSDKIRELAQRDELVAMGFAAGAFIGFVV
jgi:hypothetical protein